MRYFGFKHSIHHSSKTPDTSTTCPRKTRLYLLLVLCSSKKLLKPRIPRQHAGEARFHLLPLKNPRYLDNMPEKQDSIYYVSGDSVDVIEKLPNLQIFKKKDIEVLLKSTKTTK
jgi:heat shock protein 90kDa beta